MSEQSIPIIDGTEHYQGGNPADYIFDLVQKNISNANPIEWGTIDNPVERQYRLISRCLAALHKKGDNLERTRVQIESIIPLVRGEHLQAETGLGKSQRIIPTVAVVLALTSDRYPIILSTENPTLQHELMQNVQFLISSLSLDVEITVRLLEQEHNELPYSQDEQQLLNQYREDMKKGRLRDMLEGNKDPIHEGRAFVKYSLLKYVLDGKYKKEEEDTSTPSDVVGAQERCIIVAHHAQLVHHDLRGQTDIFNHNPHIILDEADKLGEQYIINGPELFTHADMREAIWVWFIRYVCSNIPGIHDKYKLKDNMWQIISDDDRANIYDQARAMLSNPLHVAWTEATDRIATYIGVSHDDRDTLDTIHIHVMQIIREYIGDGGLSDEHRTSLLERELDHAIYEIGAARQEGKTYVDGLDGDTIHVRSGTGRIEEGMQFEPSYVMAIHAYQDRFGLCSMRTPNGGSTSGVGFMGKYSHCVQAISGTLIVHDPVKGPVSTAFGDYVEYCTNRPIAEMPKSDPKEIPTPQLYDDEEDLYKNMINIIKDNKPCLIHTTNEARRQSVMEYIKKHAPDITVGSIDPYTSQEDERKQCTRLADGDIDVLVTSGQVSVGADIKQSSGEHPELHTMLIGVTHSLEELLQLLGRRRKEGTSASILMDTASMYAVSSKAQKHRFDRLMQRIESLHQLQPEDAMKLLLELIHIQQDYQSNMRKATTDHVYRSMIIPLVESTMERIIVGDITRYRKFHTYLIDNGYIDTTKTNGSWVQTTIKMIGHPPELYHMIREMLYATFVSRNTLPFNYAVTVDLHEQLTRVDEITGLSVIESYVHEWMDTQRAKITWYATNQRDVLLYHDTHYGNLKGGEYLCRTTPVNERAITFERKIGNTLWAVSFEENKLGVVCEWNGSYYLLNMSPAGLMRLLDNNYYTDGDIVMHAPHPNNPSPKNGNPVVLIPSGNK